MEVKDNLVNKVTLLRQRYWLWRIDTGPFLVLYIILIFLSCFGDFFLSQLTILGLYTATLSIHFLIFLVAQFFIEFKSFLGYVCEEDVKKANMILIYPTKNSGSPTISSLNHHLLHNHDQNDKNQSHSFSLLGHEISVPLASFEYQRVLFLYTPSSSPTFTRLSYPSRGTIHDYSNSTGYSSTHNLTIAKEIFGDNEFKIPSPDFLEVYLNHLIAPFFLFQVLCLFLWSLDDYWVYSVLTLLMLLVFEGVLAQQRLLSLQMIRSMRKDPYFLYVYRMGKWELLLSDQLVPGDVISLTSDSFTTSQPPRGQKQSKVERYVPCDAVIIRGCCVVNEAMLTGESVPQVKESIRIACGEEENIDLGDDSEPHPLWRRHMVFGGSTLNQSSETSADEDQHLKGGGSHRFKIPLAPDAGCQVLVVRTGYGTIQGGLMRKILFATERVTVNSREIFVFIGILLLFALLSSSLVLYVCLNDPHRNQFKVILHCIMIITSVVPPELPMELSLAVTNSLSALAQEFIFCTEPYRIPFAGRVNFICFDKTGTLTQDRMILRGVVDPQRIDLLEKVVSNSDQSVLKEIDEIPVTTTTLTDVEESGNGMLLGMACCQSLFHTGNGEVLGDPLEVECFNQSGYKVVSPLSEKLPSFSPLASNLKCTKSGITSRVVQRYQFSSELKRMSVITNTTFQKGKTHWILFCKGAPEILQKFLVTIPKEYESTFLYHMKTGRRVIALTYRILTDYDPSRSHLNRIQAESNLLFLGFLVFRSALKPATKGVIKELKVTNIPLVIVTGDNVYTAAEVARKLTIIKNESPLLLLSLSPLSEESPVRWRIDSRHDSSMEPLDSSFISFESSTFHSLSQTYTLSVTGQALSKLESCYSSEIFTNLLRQLCPHVKIFSRVNPAQKEIITKALNLEGYYTLFCGDGTNDCGALKAAHVGVSIINNLELEKKIQTSYLQSVENSTSTKKLSQRDRLIRTTFELQHQKDDPTLVKLGDASIASPFTARRTSIECVVSILRRGRCTLVTTIQVYKVLALNCLVSAYMMSSLYLQGLKQGDIQMTVTGFMTAALFYLISIAKPLPNLAEKKPPGSVFDTSVLISIFGQFVVHLSCLFLVLYLCYEERGVGMEIIASSSSSSSSLSSSSLVDPQFHPNLINTVVYLLFTTIQVNNFFVNYRGAPFIENISENWILLWSFLAIYGTLFMIISGSIEPLNDLLQLSPFPSLFFQFRVGFIFFCNLFFSFFIEKYSQQFE